MLEFKNVSLTEGSNPILSDLNLQITPKELIAIIGASGAGKSSLFRLLIGERFPTQGRIELDGTSLGDLTPSSVQKYRRQVGIIFQDYKLLKEKTVFENVAFALEVCGEDHHIPSRVPTLLQSVGLAEKRDAFPRELSGGERQRVAIARALVHEPKILIADEATGNLDPKNSREIAEIFAHLNQERGLTIIFATHDPILVKSLRPRVIRLHEGEIMHDTRNASLEKIFEGII